MPGINSANGHCMPFQVMMRCRYSSAMALLTSCGEELAYRTSTAETLIATPRLASNQPESGVSDIQQMPNGI